MTLAARPHPVVLQPLSLLWQGGLIWLPLARSFAVQQKKKVVNRCRLDLTIPRPDLGPAYDD